MLNYRVHSIYTFLEVVTMLSTFQIKISSELGAVTQAYNPSTRPGQEDPEFEAELL